MKKTLRVLSAGFCIIMCAIFSAGAEELQSMFNKYEIINTPDRIVAGIDAAGLVAYVREENGIAVYDITEDRKLFVLSGADSKLGPWYSDDTAVVINAHGEAEGTISKKGKFVARFPEGYAYAGEFKNGLISLINKNEKENVFNIFDRKGNLIASDFFSPECELDDGSIVIINKGGGFSKISKKGKVSEFKCAKNVLIEDAVSKHNGVYVSTDGNIYNKQNKLVYKNDDGEVVSPIDENYALKVSLEDTEYKRYIIDINNNKLIAVSDNGMFDGYIYSGGEAVDGAAFIGNSEKSVLVSLTTGEVISEEVLSYSKFCEGVSAVRFVDGSYGYIDTKGKLVSEKFDYAAGFVNGYAAAIKKEGDKTRVYVIFPDGNKKEVYSFDAYKTLTVGDKKVVMSYTDQKGIDNEITLQNTENGDMYVGGANSGAYLYEYVEASSPVLTAIKWAVALIAVIYIVLLGIATFKRKKKAA